MLLSQLLLLFSTAVIGQRTLGTQIDFTESDIQEIVNTHNFFRSIVVPPASNMQQIVSFSYKLEYVTTNIHGICLVHNDKLNIHTRNP